jgi:hypothetical protein
MFIFSPPRIARVNTTPHDILQYQTIILIALSESFIYNILNTHNSFYLFHAEIRGNTGDGTQNAMHGAILSHSLCYGD